MGDARSGGNARMIAVDNPVACPRCPLQKCSGLRPLEPRQRDYMQAFKRGEVLVERLGAVVRQGQPLNHLYTVLEGVLIRYRELDDGRRQIVNFMFPGDLIGLQGAFDEAPTHSVEALLPARLCVFDQSGFAELIGTHPRLGYDLTWLAAKEETALEEHIVALGRRSAKERVTYLAVWLLDRAIGVGMVDKDNRLALPIKQTQIADMLGLSLVHTNRTIKSLARNGLVEWKPGEICVADLDAASEYAQFDRHVGQRRPFI
jgi:CRP/FNR family transcriptional regulator, anaerobic regulatory protein